ncbi:MAG: hypothetical protein HWD84_09300, partial [Flavobacteriaceae bacterium]|nr:hypothetical protein [Flavobacteriaceae bacterium]
MNQRRSSLSTIIILFLGLFLSANKGYSQFSITGNTPVNKGTSHTYTLSGPTGTLVSANWSSSKGTVTSSSLTQATVNWTTAGTGNVSVMGFDSSGDPHMAFKSVTINNVAPSTPSTPVANNYICGSVTLNQVGTPPSGVTWYWQSSSTGTSTSNSATSYNVSSSGTYYLRAYDSGAALWSTGSSSVTVSVYVIPATPPTPTVTNNCGNTVLTRATPPSGIAYYWQTSATGTSTSNYNNTVTLTSGTTYYLRARNTSTNCWSTSSASVSYTVNAVPATPPTPTVSNNCGNTVLTRATPPSGITYYWQSSSGGTSTSNSSSTVTRTSGTSYYLRARN